jgi:hypothetical protein
MVDAEMTKAGQRQLSKRQRQVLALMRDRGPVRFAGRTRGFVWYYGMGGIIIVRAYQRPEYFLKARGLIEEYPITPRGVAPRYRLTDIGRERAKRIFGAPYPAPLDAAKGPLR